MRADLLLLLLTFYGAWRSRRDATTHTPATHRLRQRMRCGAAHTLNLVGSRGAKPVTVPVISPVVPRAGKFISMTIWALQSEAAPSAALKYAAFNKLLRILDRGRLHKMLQADNTLVVLCDECAALL